MFFRFLSVIFLKLPCIYLLYFKGIQVRLQHMKNKVTPQSHVLPQNSEAIDVRKVAHHPPSRCVVVCNDYPY